LARAARTSAPLRLSGEMKLRPAQLRIQADEFVKNRRLNICQLIEFGIGQREGGRNQGLSAGHRVGIAPLKP